MEEHFVLGFSLAPGIGPKGFQKIIKILGSEIAAWNAGEEDFKKAGIGKVNFLKFDHFRKSFNHSVYYEKMAKAKVDYVSFSRSYYPEILKKIESPPIGLFIKGNKELLKENDLLAVVGARKITNYGRQVTETLVADLSFSGFTIVSGMALGIDAVAHKTALKNEGFTIAVLGCGVDCPFPRENEKLYEEIIDSSGLIVSEYPLGMQPNAGTFPARNRIIAGISLGVLVTEAAEDSGSLITAGHGFEQKKPVFAVPGPITSKTSAGTLKLIKQGAIIVSSASDILDTLNIKAKNSKMKNSIKSLNLTEDEKRVYKILENEEKTVDEIIRETKIPITVLSTILSGLEISGLIKRSSGKFSVV